MIFNKPLTRVAALAEPPPNPEEIGIFFSISILNRLQSVPRCEDRNSIVSCIRKSFFELRYLPNDPEKVILRF